MLLIISGRIHAQAGRITWFPLKGDAIRNELAYILLGHWLKRDSGWTQTEVFVFLSPCLDTGYE